MHLKKWAKLRNSASIGGHTWDAVKVQCCARQVSTLSSTLQLHCRMRESHYLWRWQNIAHGCKLWPAESSSIQRDCAVSPPTHDRPWDGFYFYFVASSLCVTPASMCPSLYFTFVPSACLHLKVLFPPELSFSFSPLFFKFFCTLLQKKKTLNLNC